MFRFLTASLALAAVCLAPMAVSAAGPFQKLAIQKAAVQKTAVQKSAVQKTVVQKAPMEVVQKAPMPVIQKSPLSVFQKGPMPVVQKSYVGKACAPPVRYVQRRPCKQTCCGCTTPIQTVLYVQDPRACTPCPVAVPVCLPGCCAGAPQVTSMVGLLGRGNVCYRWCCGYHVKVVFDHHGGVIVNYYGA